MKLDEIIPLLGNFSRYQFAMVAYMGLINIFTCWTTLGNVFFAAKTDHWCSLNETCSSWPEFGDNCTQVTRSILIPPQEDPNYSHSPYSNCLQWELPEGYVFDPYTPLDRFNYSKVPCSDWEFDTTQYKTTIISDFRLVCGDGSLPSLVQSVYFAGLLVGSLVFGTLSDWIGRKKVLVVAVLCWVLGFIVTSFSKSIYMFAAFRFIAACGSLGSYVSCYILVLEVVGKSWRVAVTMVAGVFFAIGYFFLATAAMFVRDWRTLCLVLSLTSVIIIIPLPFIQESICWLLSKDKPDEAEKVIRRLAKINRRKLPEVLFDASDIQEQQEMKRKVPPSALDLYRTPNMAAKTVNMMFNWFVNSLVYYGLSQSTGDLGVDDYWAFFVSGAVEIPALLYAIYGVERFGRKWNTSVLELIGGITCLATIVIPDGIARTIVAMIGKFCISATYSIIYLYSTELFPTPVRAVGLGVCSVSARIGGILSPIILLLKESAVNLPLILFGSSAVIAGLLVLFLPETKGQKLPQTLHEGEEFGKCRCLRRNMDDLADIELKESDTNEDGVANLDPVF